MFTSSVTPRLAVLAGGAIGTALRLAVVTVVPAAPWGTLLVNVTGAGALGLLVGSLRGRVASPTALLVGTGVLGAFTTFSALAVELVAVLEAAPPSAIVHGLGSLGFGLAAATLGVSAGDRRSHRTAGE